MRELILRIVARFDPKIDALPLRVKPGLAEKRFRKEC
jgi:hypothetical protein